MKGDEGGMTEEMKRNVGGMKRGSEGGTEGNEGGRGMKENIYPSMFIF